MIVLCILKYLPKYLPQLVITHAYSATRATPIENPQLNITMKSDMPSDGKQPPPTVREWTVSRSLFRAFLPTLCQELNNAYPSTDTTPHATTWHNSGINEESTKWKDLVAFAEKPNKKFSTTQTGPAVIRKIVTKLPVLKDIFEFEYHTNGKVTITKKSSKSEQPKQESTSTMTETAETAPESETKDDKTTGWNLVKRGNKSPTVEAKKPPPTQPDTTQETNTNPFAELAPSSTTNEENEDDTGISYDTPDKAQESPMSDKSSSQLPSSSSNDASDNSPKYQEYINVKSVQNLIENEQAHLCSIEELAIYINSSTHEFKKSYNKAKETIQQQKQDVLQVCTSNESKANQCIDVIDEVLGAAKSAINGEIAKLKSDMNEAMIKAKSEIDGHSSTQVLSCTTQITNNYNDTVKDLEQFRKDYKKMNETVDRRMKFFDTIGELVTKTEETVKSVIEKEKLDFEEHLAETSEQELQALHSNAPEEMMNNLLNRIITLEEDQKEQLKFSEEKQTESNELIQHLQTKISTMEATINKINIKSRINQHLPNNNNNNDTSNSNAPTSFQPRPQPNNYPIDDGDNPRIKPNTLLDYQRGMLRLTNIRTIQSYRAPDTIWKYTCVTVSNTMVHDIEAAYMTNIRPLDPEHQDAPTSYQPPPSFESTPHTSRPSSRTSIGMPPRPTSKSSTYHRNNITSSASIRNYNDNPFNYDDHSKDESLSSEPEIMFVGHQYRYPKNSRTLSKVHYSYVTDKGSKWNITLKNEQSMKPFYDALVNRMNEAGILLRPWDTIVKDESLATITAQNCDNYENAYKSMAQAIFNYLDDNKDSIFKSYTLPIGFIEGYRSTGDGFKVLYQTLAVNHPALVDLVNSKEEAIKPTMEEHHGNIYTFCNSLKDFYDYEYKGLSDRPKHHKRKVLKYIKGQIEPDSRYEKAVNYIDNQLQLIYANTANPLPFPENLTLEGTIAVTLMTQIPQHIQGDINNNITDGSTFTIHRTLTRNGKNRSTPTKYSKPHTTSKGETPPQATRPPPRRAIDEICSACGQSGHDIATTGCDAMAQLQLLEKYNQRHNQKHINKATQLYQKHQQQRHKMRNFQKDIDEYKQSIKAFKQQYDGCDTATVKQLYLESFREEVDPAAEDDIFDDVLDDTSQSQQDEQSELDDDDSSSQE